MLVNLEWVSVLADWAIRAQSGRWGVGDCVGFYHHIFFFICFLNVLFTPIFFALLNSLFGLIIVFYTPLSLRHRNGFPFK